MFRHCPQNKIFYIIPSLQGRSRQSLRLHSTGIGPFGLTSLSGLECLDSRLFSEKQSAGRQSWTKATQSILSRMQFGLLMPPWWSIILRPRCRCSSMVLSCYICFLFIYQDRPERFQTSKIANVIGGLRYKSQIRIQKHGLCPLYSQCNWWQHTCSLILTLASSSLLEESLHDYQTSEIRTYCMFERA